MLDTKLPDDKEAPEETPDVRTLVEMREEF